MPDYTREIPFEEPEAERPFLLIASEELCRDESCNDCYPPNEEDITEDEALLQRLSESQSFFGSSNTTNETIQAAWDQIQQQVDSNTEGEDVPDTFIGPETNPEENPALTVPDIRAVVFMTRGSTTLRAGERFPDLSNGRSAVNCQISFWDLTPENLRNSFAELKEWMSDNRIGYSSYSSDYFVENAIQANVPYYFALVPEGHSEFNEFSELISQPNCSCGAEIEFPTVKCPDCESLQYCTTCRKFSSSVTFDSTYGVCCSDCGLVCDNSSCGITYHANHRSCNACYPRVNCNSCQAIILVAADIVHEHEGNSYCDDCFEYLCFSCQQIVEEREYILPEEDHRCLTCVSRDNNEEWDGDSVLEASDIVIPTIPGREVIRLVGVEIEGANGDGLDRREGGNLLAHRLYTEGISASNSMTGYHSSDGRRMSVHVERDSSVDWELVIGPMNVADENQVNLMNRSVKVVRNMINDKTLKLDMRGGMHVHVGADKVPFHNAYNLHKLYMYMEDWLYRVGAAKWPYHRSVNRRGTDASGKSPSTEGKLNFARTFSGQRYYGLSFDNYFNRYFEGCRCGARQYGLFDECTCELGKCTFEFRLFNTTANTRKIHAYLAICQALVAKSIELDEITDASAFPALDFTNTRVSDMHPSTRNKYIREWEKRTVFVNEQLPLTPEEKESIHYCIVNCELGKVTTNADILLETEDN